MDHQQSLIPRGDDVPEEADNSAVEWTAVPRHAAADRPIAVVLSFETEAERDALVAELGVAVAKRGVSWTARWPPREDDDPQMTFA